MQLNDTHALAVFARARRRELGLTQAEFALKVGVGREWVVRLEKGSPRLEVGKVLDALNVLGATPEVETARSRVTDADADGDPFADVFANLKVSK